jgi:hypothetical protein
VQTGTARSGKPEKSAPQGHFLRGVLVGRQVLHRCGHLLGAGDSVRIDKIRQPAPDCTMTAVK